MANLTGTDSWDDVYQLETTDPVVGGDGGISNDQAQQLLNRTEWLKKRMGIISAFAGITAITGSTTLLSGTVGYLQMINGAAGAISLTLPDPTSLANCLIPMIAYNISSQIRLIGNVFYGGVVGNVYLGNNEQIILISDGKNWNLLAVDYNADKVGDIFHSYKQSARAIALSGQLLNRADYPRLYNWASTSGLMYADSTWLNSINYQGFFSSGNGTTNFRVPDLRGQFVRGFDGGRGLDNYRIINSVGGYELDDNKSHFHSLNGNINTNASGAGGVLTATYTGYESISDTNTYGGVTKRTMELVGTEARPKNIGLIPQMYV